MTKYNEVVIQNPYGKNDSVLQIQIDSELNTYRLKNVIANADIYTFIIWYKADLNCDITFNVLGTTETVSATNEWQKYTKTVEIETLNNCNIDITPSQNSVTYFYEGYLVKGDISSDWTPAPEDIIYSITNIEQTATDIIARVENNENNIAQIIIDSEKVRLESSDNTDALKILNETTLPQLEKDLSKKVDDAAAAWNVAKERIDGEVISIKNDKIDKSFFTQTADGFRMKFAEIGMADDEWNIKNVGNVTYVSKDGIRVSNRDPSDITAKIAGNTTLIDAASFRGFVNDGTQTGDGELMFELNKNYVYTERLKAPNGADFGTMKVVPAVYGTAKGLNFINSDGNA